MSTDMHQLLTAATIDVPAAGRLLGLAEKAAYRAREAGDIPSIRVGGKFRVPTTKLRALLGIAEPDLKSNAA